MDDICEELILIDNLRNVALNHIVTCRKNDLCNISLIGMRATAEILRKLIILNQVESSQIIRADFIISNFPIEHKYK